MASRNDAAASGEPEGAGACGSSNGKEGPADDATDGAVAAAAAALAAGGAAPTCAAAETADDAAGRASSAARTATPGPLPGAVPASFTLRTIGVVRSPFRQKFGIPRQPGLVPAAVATVELVPPFATADAVRGLDGWSHVWVTFVFHAIPEEQVAPGRYKATVHPPRGSAKYGVWATRTTHRPNRLGLSLCELVGVETDAGRGRGGGGWRGGGGDGCDGAGSGGGGGVRLLLRGADLLDGTPVLDIKPYLPYAECVPDARAGFAPTAPPRVPVAWAPEAEAGLASSALPSLRDLAEQVLAQDPRPTWQQREGGAARDDKTYCLHLADARITWRFDPLGGAGGAVGTSPAPPTQGTIVVVGCEPLAQASGGGDAADKGGDGGGSK